MPPILFPPPYVVFPSPRHYRLNLVCHVFPRPDAENVVQLFERNVVETAFFIAKSRASCLGDEEENED